MENQGITAGTRKFEPSLTAKPEGVVLSNADKQATLSKNPSWSNRKIGATAEPAPQVPIDIKAQLEASLAAQGEKGAGLPPPLPNESAAHYQRRVNIGFDKAEKAVAAAKVGAKGAKLAETSPGADQLGELLDATQGKGRLGKVNPEGHGTMPAPPKGKGLAVGKKKVSDITEMAPQDQSKALNRLKSEKGAISTEMLVRAGLGTAGALAGAAMTPDDPWTGAIMGGTAGAFSPTVARALIGRISSNPNIGDGTIQQVADKIRESVGAFAKMMPDYQRFAYLAHPINLLVNIFVGPWGSSIMASIEHTMAGDRRGLAALKLLLNPKNFPKEWASARVEAGERIAQAEGRTEGLMGQQGPEIYRQIVGAPAKAMTAGDIAAKRLLMRAGFTKEEVERITLTNEPYHAIGRGITALKKGARTEGGKRSWFFDMTIPFYRTATNQLESGLERMPFGLGAIYQKVAKDIPDSNKKIIAQQMLSAGGFGASYLLGTVTPEDDVKWVRKVLGDFGGQYGAIYSAAFLMGQAKRRGKSQIMAAAGSAANSTPLPTMDVITNTATMLKKLDEGKSFGFNKEDAHLPIKVLPGILDPNVSQSLPSLFMPSTNSTPTRPTRPVTASSSRYKPPPR